MGDELPSFDRNDIETAMVFYDKYRDSGDYADVFNRFNGIRTDYWVRSTRRLPDERVYPAHAIVGFLRKEKGLSISHINSGWEQGDSAASVLYNSGFIIVFMRSDVPILSPKKYQHLLIDDADHIRLCIVNYYIEPARERGAQKVSIPVEDLVRDMGLGYRAEAFSCVCDVLASEELKQLANVPAPQVDSKIRIKILGARVPDRQRVRTSLPGNPEFLLGAIENLEETDDGVCFTCSTQFLKEKRINIDSDTHASSVVILREPTPKIFTYRLAVDAPSVF